METHKCDLFYCMSTEFSPYLLILGDRNIQKISQHTKNLGLKLQRWKVEGRWKVLATAIFKAGLFLGNNTSARLLKASVIENVELSGELHRSLVRFDSDYSSLSEYSL